jgi:molecular chaperone DnaJ
MALRVSGHGMASQAKGGIAGDLFVVLRSIPDDRFVRHGIHLWRPEPVSLPEAVLGGRRKVPTVDGSVEVTVPPGSQPGSVLRLAGKGLPVLGGGRRGDLYLRLDVTVPEHPSRAERALYEKLRDLESKRAAAEG